MRGTKGATWTWVLGMVVACCIGFGAGTLQREAHAQSIATSTIYVPAGGLVFRAADGTPLARLSRSPHGGSFEVFDDRVEERVAPAKDRGSKGYVLDDGDPWRAPVVPRDRPTAGF
jgi:hypothetical protein